MRNKVYLAFVSFAKTEPELSYQSNKPILYRVIHRRQRYLEVHGGDFFQKAESSFGEAMRRRV